MFTYEEIKIIKKKSDVIYELFSFTKFISLIPKADFEILKFSMRG